MYCTEFRNAYYAIYLHTTQYIVYYGVLYCI